jgi:hypothetical protein
MTVHNVMAERRPDLLDRLYQPFPVDRRGEVPEGKAPFYEAPVFNEHAGYVSVLYSRLHIGSAQRFPKAIRLCGGVRGVLWTIDGEHGHLAAARGLSAEFIALLRQRGESGTNPALQQIIGGQRLIEFSDVAESELYRSGDPIAKAAVEAGVRSLIWVALVGEGVARRLGLSGRFMFG